MATQLQIASNGKMTSFAISDAERNGKVQRILAAISMCPALDSFLRFFRLFCEQ